MFTPPIPPSGRRAVDIGSWLADYSYKSTNHKMTTVTLIEHSMGLVVQTYVIDCLFFWPRISIALCIYSNYKDRMGDIELNLPLFKNWNLTCYVFFTCEPACTEHKRFGACDSTLHSIFIFLSSKRWIVNGDIYWFLVFIMHPTFI